MTGCFEMGKPFLFSHKKLIGVSWASACIAFLLFICVFIQGCAQRYAMTTSNMDDLKPRLQVYVCPRWQIDTRTQKALIALIDMPSDINKAYGNEMTRMLQYVLLQHRIFMVTELAKEHMSNTKLIQLGRSQGIDYLILAKVPQVVVPVGDTPGWIGLDIRILHVQSGITIWHIYSEADLVPRLGSYGILADSPYRPAPSVTQGFMALCRASADVIANKVDGQSAAQDLAAVVN